MGVEPIEDSIIGDDMPPSYTLLSDPLRAQPIPDEGILTRPLFEDATLRAVLFTFSAGQRLSEHTASSPALLHFLAGEASLTLGKDRVKARPGTWVRMDAGLIHAIEAESPLVMLLILVKSPEKRD